MAGPSTDLTALSWCLGEIRESLARAEAALEQQLQSESDDNARLRAARGWLHQAHGALQVVDLEGVATITQEAEALLDRCDRGELKFNGDVVRPVTRAFAAIVEYLEGLVGGSNDSAVALFPHYRDLLALRESDRVEPSDLYAVDLSVRPPKLNDGEPLDPASLVRVRTDFERGLLGFLRNPRDAESLSAMHGAVDRLHRAHQASSQRTFWWLATAFFDALRMQALPVDLYAKRLVARINLQIRSTLAQGSPIADRMLRDLLFMLARTGSGSALADEARRLYKLAGTVPSDFETPRYGVIDARTLRTAREATAAAKAAWERYVRGSAQDLPPFAQAAQQLDTAVARLPWPGLQKLSGALIALRRALAATGSSLAEVLSLEVATALLFVEQALDRGSRGIAQHDRRATEMAARIDLLTERQEHDGSPMPEWLTELSRAAQERLTIAAFVGELQANLRGCEKTLDAFFRDPAERTELPGLETLLRQVGGALRLLGHTEAAEGADTVMQQVAAFADAEDPPSQAECERVAHSLGALGFFVESLRQAERHGGFEFRRGDDGFVARLGEPPAQRADSPDSGPDATLPLAVAGIAPFDVSEPMAGTEPPVALAGFGGSTAMVESDGGASLERLLAERRATVRPCLAMLQARPTDPALRGVLRDALIAVRDEAMLLDDAVLRADAAEAVALLEAGEAPDSRALVGAVARVAGEGVDAPIEPVSVPPEDAIDAELLGVFLDEADEVLAAIDEHSAASAASPADVDHLTTLRRGFHTLKGSSRMVGLGTFGEAAWTMEQMLNGWLADERPGTPELYACVDDAHAEMLGWVARLRDDARAPIDPNPLIARLQSLHREAPLPADVPAALRPPVDVAPALQASAADTAADTMAPDVGGVEDTVAEDATFEGAIAEDEPLIGLDVEVDLPEATIEEATIEEAPGTGSKDTPVEPVSLIDLSSLGLPLDERGPDAVFDTITLEPEDTLDGLIELTDVLDPSDLEFPTLSPLDEIESSAVGAPVSADALDTLDPQLSHDAHDAESGRIGDRTIGAQLHRIFRDEAAQLLAILDAAHARWREAPATPVAEEVLRSVHSLGGSSRIVGLADVHSTADALERFMLGRSLATAPLGAEDLDDLGFVLARLRVAIDRFAAGSEPPADADMTARAEALAARWAAPEPEAALEPEAAPIAGIADEPVTASSADVPAVVPSPMPSPMPSAMPAPVGSDIVEGLAGLVDDIDPELAAVFIEEADELLPRIGDALRAWVQHPDDASNPGALMRLLHTVKGSARMAGAMRLGQLVHDMEARIESAIKLPQVPPALVDDLVARNDQVLALYEAVRDPRSEAAQAASRAVIASLSGPSAAPDEAPVSAAAEDTPVASELRSPARSGVAAAGPQQLIRVRADLLDRLVNEAGEVSIARARLENELGGIRQSLGELTENVNRLRSQLREIELAADSQIQARTAKEIEAEFDPLEFDRYTRFQELTRMLAESVNDVATVQHNALRNLDEAQRDLARQSQVTRDLQQDLMRIRMVQFGSIADRLYRVVRQAAKELDKRVHLDLKGATAELDRGVLERMAGPIEHLLRNAVAHGIESRADRIAAGKSETGEITLEVRQEANEVILSSADDGGGLDYTKIRARAVQRGLIAADAHPGERELADLIFMPGFSTASEVTAIAGRGVGMDVVRAEVAAMGGRIDLESVPGKGTRFTVHLPVSLAVAQVVLLTVGGFRTSVASALIEQVLQMKPEALAAAYAEHNVDWQGQPVPLYFFGSLLELPGCTPLAQRYSPVVILRSGSQRIALHVDHVAPSQEVVVKHVGPQLARLTGMAGATVLGNGEIVLILNPVQIAATGRGAQAGQGDTASFAPTRIEIAPTVMVVDDSVTVRKVTQRLLLREGFQVMLAKDGVDALRQLQDTVPDVMLLDIEMPRMDGFDLTRNLRGDDRWKHLPIVMITSRTADKHRSHAMSLGVDAFLGKPYDEVELLQEIRTMLARRQLAG